MAVSAKTAVAIASGVLTLGAGLGVSNFAYADATRTPIPTSAPSDIPSPETEPPVEPGNPEARSSDDALIEELSRVLGIDVETLKAMLEEVRATYGDEWSAAVEEQLDAAVQAGILTQDEADAVRKAIDEGINNLGR